MLQFIDKGKFYLYILIFFILLSVHNINYANSLNHFFKIKKVIIESTIEENLSKEISKSLKYLYNKNIFLINSKDISSILDNFNTIGKYNIRKNYPSIIRIKIKETDILAYFIDNNQKTFVGNNGKKIIKKNIKDKIPLIIGRVNIQEFLAFRIKLEKNGFSLDDFNKFYTYKSGRWDLMYKNKIIIKLPKDDLDNSLIILKKIINNNNLDNLNVIDLRIQKKIILS